MNFKQVSMMVLLIFFLQGCATQLAPRPGSASDDTESASEALVLRFQHSSIAPTGDDAFVAPEALQPGDILLTSMSNLRSAAIRLMTFAPVSHVAVYIGDGQVVEAVGSGVRVRGIDELLEEETVVLVLRYPDLSAEQARNIKDYALKKSGTGFSYLGVTLHVPLSISRRLCELPLVPSAVRDACIRSMGVISHVAASESRLFCSQLVLQAYRHAEVPMTYADPRLISPADILHMREGDVPSVRIHRQLRYAGHLKYPPPMMVALQR
jgi:uncharacterized protein (DUF433 family)